MTTINLEHIDQPSTGTTRFYGYIYPDPDNVRSDDRTDIEGLAQSILINGLIQPIVLDFENKIIAGHRRHAAIGYLIEQGALPQDYGIPVVYYDQASGEANTGSTQLMLVENLQRVDLDPIEEALGYQRLVDMYGLKHTEVGERLGRSGSLVSSRLRLLRLPEMAQRMLKMGALRLDVAEALVPLSKYPDIVIECLNLGLGVSQIETRVARMKQAEKLAKVKDIIDSKGAYAILDRQELTERNLGVEHKQVPIEFTTADELTAKIVRDEVYYLTVNFKDEVQIHFTYEMEAASKPGENPEAAAQKEKERKQKEAIRVRRATLMELINTVSLPKADVEEMLDLVLVKSMNAAQLKFVTVLLGIPKEDIPETKYSTEASRSYDYGQAVLELLQAGGKKASRCRVAIIIGSEEVYAGVTPSKTYSDLLSRFGYRINRSGRLVMVTDDGKDVDAETGEVTDGDD